MCGRRTLRYQLLPGRRRGGLSWSTGVVTTTIYTQDDPCERTDCQCTLWKSETSEVKSIWPMRSSNGCQLDRLFKEELGLWWLLLVLPCRELAEWEWAERTLTQWCAGHPPRRHRRCRDPESSSSPPQAGWGAVRAAAAPPPPPAKRQVCVSPGHHRDGPRAPEGGAQKLGMVLQPTRPLPAHPKTCHAFHVHLLLAAQYMIFSFHSRVQTLLFKAISGYFCTSVAASRFCLHPAPLT